MVRGVSRNVLSFLAKRMLGPFSSDSIYLNHIRTSSDYEQLLVIFVRVLSCEPVDLLRRVQQMSMLVYRWSFDAGGGCFNAILCFVIKDGELVGTLSLHVLSMRDARCDKARLVSGCTGAVESNRVRKICVKANSGSPTLLSSGHIACAGDGGAGLSSRMNTAKTYGPTTKLTHPCNYLIQHHSNVSILVVAP